jgi:DNA-directed RNA polymerase specialized sigma24 family protein
MTDEEFIDGIQGFDASVMKAFYDTFKEPVERSCAFFLGDDQALGEVILLTFKEALEEINAKGKPDLPLKPWLSILSVRHCFTVMEKRRKEFEVQGKSLEALARRVPVLQEITTDDRERVNFMVRGEIDDIPEPHKQILAMYEMDGLNLLELAKRLSAAWVTALSRLYYARVSLEERVKAQFKA